MNVSVYRRDIGAAAAHFVDGSRPAAKEHARAPRNPSAVTTTCITDLAALEAAVQDGPLREWRRLAEEAPHASLFQTPGWCMPWYRCYHDDYSPFVVAVTVAGELVGVVPLAVERGSGKLVFASDSMADYRDIVALPEYRALVVRELLNVFRQGRFPDPLQIGWLDPQSDTRSLLEDICREEGLRFRVRHQPCYRWFPPPPQKPSAQKFLNWYKRQGTVDFEVVDSHDAWSNFRDDYYRQHSLRQIQAGRERAFDDPRRTALYEQLFNSDEVQRHVTAFRLDGRLLAGHFGYVWRDVLLLGPPAIRLEDEQRSPAVILLAWIIQNAERLGLRGFDLTIGDSDFKKRLGNQCVELTAVDVYASRWAYFRQRVRSAVMNGAKALVARVAGADAWNDHVKPAFEKLAYKRARLREEGLSRAIETLARALASAVWERRRGHIYAITPGEMRPVSARLGAGERLEFHENRVEDLLLWHGTSLTTASDITQCARSYSRCLASGRTLHTVILNDRLAGWGYSYYPDRPAELTETPGAVLEFPAGAVSLYDFHVLPAFRGRRIYQALLAHILGQRFAEGAPAAFITVLESNAPSRVAIERVGFRLTGANEYRRFLRWRRLQPVNVR